MTEYKISATRSGSHETMGDWDADYEITFRVVPLYIGPPAAAMEFAKMEFVSIKPGAGDHGVFSDLADKWLEEWAQEWLDTDGYDVALAIATSKSDVSREIAP